MSMSMAAGLPQPPKPLNLPELLDRAFQEYRRHFLFFATIAIICVLPEVIADWIWGYGLPILGTRLLVAPFALGLLYISATQVVIWNEASLTAVLQAALLRYFAFAGVVFGYILCAISLVLVLPLGLWIFVRWSMAAPSVAAEPIGSKAAIRRSNVLVKGAWWRCFATIVAVVGLSAVVAVILGMCAGVAVAFVPLPEYTSMMLAGTAAVLTGSLVTPLVAIAFSLLYVDLRVRKEGFDLDYLARSAAQAA
ncbi:MAG TPA: hypothetical protein VM674_00105 [Candidatus Acidoferrum sp.]|nr:hypothetical protein [Candidatus Acidoferrum sp.]